MRSSAYVAAYNQKDAAKLVEFFTPDGTLIDSDNVATRGREAIAQEFSEAFAEPSTYTLEGNVERIRLITPDVAQVEGESRLVSPKEATIANHFVALLARQGDAWKLVEIRDYPSPAATVTPYERIKELEWMVGDWVDDSEDAEVSSTVQWGQGKAYLVRNYSVHIKGQPATSGLMIIAWEPQTEQIKSWIFNADGSRGEGSWTRASDNQWVVKASGSTGDGQPNSATQIISLVNKDAVKTSSVDRIVGGEIARDIDDLIMVRKPPAPGAGARTGQHVAGRVNHIGTLTRSRYISVEVSSDVQKALARSVRNVRGGLVRRDHDGPARTWRWSTWRRRATGRHVTTRWPTRWRRRLPTSSANSITAGWHVAPRDAARWRRHEPAANNARRYESTRRHDSTGHTFQAASAVIAREVRAAIDPRRFQAASAATALAAVATARALVEATDRRRSLAASAATAPELVAATDPRLFLANIGGNRPGIGAAIDLAASVAVIRPGGRAIVPVSEAGIDPDSAVVIARESLEATDHLFLAASVLVAITDPAWAIALASPAIGRDWGIDRDSGITALAAGCWAVATVSATLAAATSAAEVIRGGNNIGIGSIGGGTVEATTL